MWPNVASNFYGSLSPKSTLFPGYIQHNNPKVYTFICSLFHAIFTKCISDMNLLPICETMENRKRKGEYELTMFGSTKLRGCEDFWKCEGHEWEKCRLSGSPCEARAEDLEKPRQNAWDFAKEHTKNKCVLDHFRNDQDKHNVNEEESNQMKW